MKASKELLEGLQVSLRGIGLGGAKNAQRRGSILARAYCNILKATEEARIDVFSHSGKGRGGHVRKAI
jgi:predicted TIM-barrel fold metal-dependent hydrolase